LILLGTSGQQAFATPGLATYKFDVSNGGSGAPVSGNFGTATINVISTVQATISFTAAPNFTFIGFGFNFNGTVHEPGGSTGSITNIAAGSGIPATWSDTGTNSMDGFGTFTHDFEGSGASPSSQTTSGTLNITGTNLELSNFKVLSGDPAGNGNKILGAHLFGQNLSGSATFFAGASVEAVPEPATLSLLACTASGLFFLRRKLGIA